MIRNAIVLTVAGAMGLGACRSAANAPPATTVGTAAAAAPAVPLDQLVPDQAGAYRRTERETLEGSAGIRFRFRDTSSVWLSLYLYSAEDGPRQYPDPAALARLEGEKFRQVMDIQAGRGLYTNLQIVESRPDTLATPRGPLIGHLIAAKGVFRGRPVYELQYLYVVDTTFVKLRATVPEADWPRTDLHGVIAAIVAPLHR